MCHHVCLCSNFLFIALDLEYDSLNYCNLLSYNVMPSTFQQYDSIFISFCLYRYRYEHTHTYIHSTYNYTFTSNCSHKKHFYCRRNL
jgi:hypothetical protein